MYTGSLLRIRSDGTDIQRLGLPPPEECQRSAEDSPHRLPDERLGYFVLCEVGSPGDPVESKLYYMAYDPHANEISVLKWFYSYKKPAWGATWLPDMSMALYSQGRKSQIIKFTPPNEFDTLELGFEVALNPSFSPDGEKVAFIGSHEEWEPFRYTEHSLYVMNRDGSNVRPLVTGIYSFYTSYPGWTRDSRGVLFSFDKQPNEFDLEGLWLFDTLTGESKLIAVGPLRLYALSPDGKRLAAVEGTFTGPSPNWDTELLIIEVGDYLEDWDDQE